jgi:hypothetical protein
MLESPLSLFKVERASRAVKITSKNRKGLHRRLRLRRQVVNPQPRRRGAPLRPRRDGDPWRHRRHFRRRDVRDHKGGGRISTCVAESADSERDLPEIHHFRRILYFFFVFICFFQRYLRQFYFIFQKNVYSKIGWIIPGRFDLFYVLPCCNIDVYVQHNKIK